MIRKRIDPRALLSPFEKAGWNAESQMAHYLDRAFKDRKDVHVFHDLRLEEKGDVAQIDHLVLEPYGFHIVESKSVTSSVRVNARDEWSRQWDGGWKGMASPLLQAERQADFLRKFLNLHGQHLIRKLFSSRDFDYGNFRWNTWVAISDQGIIRQDLEPPHQNLLKADQIPGGILETIESGKQDSRITRLPILPYSFLPETLAKLSLWILNHHRPRSVQESAPRVDPLEFHEPDPGLVKAADERPESKACRFCDSRRLEIRTGPHSLYFKCLDCAKNTPIRFQCRTPACKPKLIAREGGFFFRVCETCGTDRPYFKNPIPS
ncbi:MAG TPA: nuclease-related domain-containing protein [Fibrobacteria bacterium]|nr:nuclease-related domain-containing protein [Fibrobacteria bacterium]HOX50781.1 nuclease-related domain-containing protein [Fibrobacteria bacterium]